MSQGGESAPDGSINGSGWTAVITQLTDYRLGKMTLCSFLVEMQGEEAAVREAWHGFELRVLRPGG